MRLSSIFSDGMILQRNVPNKIWGRIDDNGNIQVLFDGKALETSVSGDEWKSEIPSTKEGGPHQITILSSNNKKTISDVYFGDVFLLGGQSNMELPVIWTTDCYYDEIISADFPLIRQFEVPKEPLFGEKKDMLTGGNWVPCTKESVGFFSAIGFYFAKYKQLKDGIPVGLVQSAVGGAPAECLMSEENVLQSYEKIAAKYKDIAPCNGDKSKACLGCYKEKLEKNKQPGYVEKTVKEDLARMDAWHQDLDQRDPGLSGNWAEHVWNEDEIVDTIELPKTFYQTQFESYLGSIWVQREVEVPESWVGKKVQLRLGTLIDGDVTYFNGMKVGETGFKYPPRRYWLPDGLLKAGKNLITVRLIMDQNIGGAVIETPFCLKNGDDEISLCGKWSVRPGATAEKLESMTFFNWEPSALFNGMIYPLRGYACKAVLFYQGESNCDYPQYYGDLLKDMLNEWRELFGHVPFLMAEVTHWLGEGPIYESDPFDGVRDVQREVIKEISDGYLIKTYDLGWYNDLHPQNKKDVAMRFLETYEQIEK